MGRVFLVHRMCVLSALILLCVSPQVLSGCARGIIEEGLPLPQQTFRDMEQLPVAAAKIIIKTDSISADSETDRHRLAAAGLPLSPETAWRRYIKRRFSPVKEFGVLEAEIGQVTLDIDKEQQGNYISRMTGAKSATKYRLRVEITLSYDPLSHDPAVTPFESHNGSGGYARFSRPGPFHPHTRLVVERQLSLPDHYTLARKDEKLALWVENMIRESDPAVVKAVYQTLQAGLPSK